MGAPAGRRGQDPLALRMRMRERERERETEKREKRGEETRKAHDLR